MGLYSYECFYQKLVIRQLFNLSLSQLLHFIDFDQHYFFLLLEHILYFKNHLSHQNLEQHLNLGSGFIQII